MKEKSIEVFNMVKENIIFINCKNLDIIKIEVDWIKRRIHVFTEKNKTLKEITNE